MARRKTGAERGPFGAWAYNTRDALDLSVEAIVAALPTHYHPATLRKVEGGGGALRTPPPSRMWRELSNLYSRLADEQKLAIDPQPRLGPEPPGAAQSPDPLIVALTAQTTAITALVGEMRLARERDQDAAAAILRAAEALRSLPRPAAGGGSTKRPVPRGTVE